MANEMLTSAEGGDAEAVRFTEPLNPPAGDAVTVKVILPPAVIIAELGVAAIVKSPAAETGMLTNRIARTPARIDTLRKAGGLL